MNSKERRLHRRVSGIIAENSRIVFADGLQLVPINISYGGFAVSLPQEKHDEIWKNQEPLEIHFKTLAKGVAAHAKPVRREGSITAFAIEYNSIEALMFLRGIFEHWQNGATARAIDNERTNQEDNEKIFINGEGPFDIVITNFHKNPLPDVLVTFLSEGEYYQVDFLNSTLRTGKTKASGATKLPGAIMNMDAKLNTEALREAICILAGIELAAYKEPIDSILQNWVKQLVATSQA
ncbi:MAG: hypothetical protein R3B45_05355 [Bdellovibrionota bacterium]